MAVACAGLPLDLHPQSAAVAVGPWLIIRAPFGPAQAAAPIDAKLGTFATNREAAARVAFPLRPGLRAAPTRSTMIEFDRAAVGIASSTSHGAGSFA